MTLRPIASAAERPIRDATTRQVRRTPARGGCDLALWAMLSALFMLEPASDAKIHADMFSHICKWRNLMGLAGFGAHRYRLACFCLSDGIGIYRRHFIQCRTVSGGTVLIHVCRDS